MSQPFITYMEGKEEGSKPEYYILQKAFPNYQGRIIEYPIPDSLVCINIPGYTLYINFAGRIDGNFVPSYKHAMEEMEAIFIQMVEWFLKEIIDKKKDKYLKFKVIK